jgi:arabinan endo-1,5-alpha-L-arabinosidase
MAFRHLLQGLLLTTLTTASPIFKRSFPEPEPITGDIYGFVHDPSVIRREDGTYFLFTTNNKTNVASAPSMSGPWTHLGPVLPNGSMIDLPGKDDLWAPDIAKIGDTYYLYYSVSDWGAQNASDIGVATSTTLEPGSWTDHGSIGIPPDQRYNRIDPNLFRETGSSTPLLAFGSFHDNIFQYPMADPPLRIAEGASYSHLSQNTTRENIEGPYQFRWVTNGHNYYYLFFSGGACCNAPDKLEPPGEEYRISVCRSESPTGGFIDKEGRDCVTENGGSLVYASHGDVYAPGGQGVFFDEGIGRVVLYYHYVKRSVGYEYEKFWFGWNKLDFGTGWPVVVK